MKNSHTEGGNVPIGCCEICAFYLDYKDDWQCNGGSMSLRCRCHPEIEKDTDTTWEQRIEQLVQWETPEHEQEVKSFIREQIRLAEEQGANMAVDYIEREFNDERYGEFTDEEDDEELTTKEKAEFLMFWSHLLKSARNAGQLPE